MWLFHFRIGQESQTKDASNAQGTGHASRSLILLQEAEKLAGVKSCVVTSGNKEAHKFLESKNIEYYSEDKLEKILKNQQIGLIVSDINYLESSTILLYRKYCPWVCLAPRGRAKHKADLAFKDVYFNDIPPKNETKGKIFSGPEYVITGPEFKDARLNIERGIIKKEPQSIIVFMGGVDEFNTTNKVLSMLTELPKDWKLRVVLGPLYTNVESLKRLVKRFSCKIELYQAPSNFHEILAQSSIGVLAAGISSYEAVGLGTPCINFNISKFHAKRSKELEELGVGINGEEVAGGEGKGLTKLVEILSNDKKRLEKMRERGMELVNERGAERIINKIYKNVFL